MKDSTRVRRLTKLWVAMDANTIYLSEAARALFRVLPDKKLAYDLTQKWNGMTDDARRRWLKEITK